CLCAALAMLLSSLIGKKIQAKKLINTLKLQGHETILDVGCGKGLLLITAAKQLNKNGKACGIDIWNQNDLSANSIQATLHNAHIENVQDRVIVQDGNACHIPFPDNHFDAVISSMMLHNIDNEENRKKALSEMVRVLKPNGTLLIQDFQHTQEYFKNVHYLPVHSIQRSKLLWYLFPPVRIVSAIKKEI
ncbi:class I SAM-dependent methyltransferase, partial [bacterium]|nr:class I SAM-dependent methyltransferase [bacterium]